jgi:anaerobic ribonucleoside-triphosphate reductase
VLNVQNCFVHWKSWINWFENDEIEINDLKNLFEIIDDKCDDEIIIHVFLQLKKKHVVNAFSNYDVLIFDNEYFKFIRHWISIV